MNLDELQSVQSRERQTDSLQQLRASFYEDAAAFVHDLREQRDKAAEKAEDPFDSPDVNRLTDDIRTAEQTVEAIYERRVGKVVKMASLAAADMPTEQEGLTKEEQELFETMVKAIEDHQETILDVLGGDAPAGTVSTPPPEDHEAVAAAVAEPEVPDEAPSAEDEDHLDASSMMADGPTESNGDGDTATPDTDTPADGRQPESTGTAEGTESSASALDAEGNDQRDAPSKEADRSDETSAAAGASGAEDTERMTVRITEDVGEIFGVDEREYDLASEDVVTLPTPNAEPLLARDAAERLDD